jgi:hypothetical protein
MPSARTTTNHKTIRKWVERHKGHPALVRTGKSGGVLRIDFDESEVAFLHGEGDSRFNKFVENESAHS